MEYEIVKAFIAQHFYRSSVLDELIQLSLSEINHAFDESFSRFKQRWIVNMQDTIIR